MTARRAGTLVPLLLAFVAPGAIASTGAPLEGMLQWGMLIMNGLLFPLLFAARTEHRATMTALQTQVSALTVAIAKLETVIEERERIAQLIESRLK